MKTSVNIIITVFIALAITIPNVSYAKSHSHGGYKSHHSNHGNYRHYNRRHHGSHNVYVGYGRHRGHHLGNLVGGLVLGAIITSAVTSNRSSHRPVQQQPLPQSVIFRETQGGNCFLVEYDEKGEEILTQVSTANCGR